MVKENIILKSNPTLYRSIILKYLVRVFSTLLLLAILGGLAMAQLTPGGTIIRNQATAFFVDSNNATQTAASNEVTTEVNTVYSFNVENDDTNLPSGGDLTGDPNVSDFSSSIFNSNLFNASAGDQVVIPYTVENNTNNPVDISLDYNEANTGIYGIAPDDNVDNYDFSNIQIYIDENNDGSLDSGDTLVSAPINFPATDGVSGSGTDFKNVLLVVTVPSTQVGNSVALIDLVATNLTAVGDGAVTDGIDNDNQTYENNNLAQVTVYEDAQIGLAKNLDDITNNGDGTYDLTFTFTVENLGNAPLDNVQITDDIDGQLATAGITVVAPPAPGGITGISTTGGLTANISPLDGTDEELLDTGNTLAVGASGTLTFTIRVDASSATSFSLTNTATATGEDQTTGATVTDISDNGTEPDTDGDGFANEGNGEIDDGDNGTPNDPSDDEGNGTTNVGEEENDPTPIVLTENGVLGVAKEIQPNTNFITPNGDGSFNVAVNIYLENTGDVDLNNVQVTEDLATVFGASTIHSDVGPDLTSNNPNIVVNPNFNGTTIDELLDSTASSLPKGETALVSFRFRITPVGGPFENQVIATGDTPTGVTITDNSHDGTDPDPEGNGPGDNDTKTPVSFTESPVIGIAKDFVGATATDNNDGTFTATYQIVVKNMGNVPLNDVQVVENFNNTFPSPATFNVIDKRSLSDGTGGQNVVLAVADAFDGNTTTNLLDASQTLGVGETAAFEITVTFDPNDSTGPFNNTAIASGSSPGGVSVNDTSQDGLDPDPEDNGPSDNGDPTPTPFTTSSAIGAAKTVFGVNDDNRPEYVVTYDVRIENIGTTTLSNVQAVENLSATFGTFYDGAGTPAVVTDISPDGSAADAASLNGSFNGSGNNNLLDGTNTLEPTEFYIIRIEVTVDLTDASTFGPFENIVTVSALDPSDTEVTDISDNGLDDDGSSVDPNNNGNANESGENDPTPITFTAPSDLSIDKWQAPVIVDTSGSGSGYPTLAQINTACDGGTYVTTKEFVNPSNATDGKYTFICYRIVAQNIHATDSLTQLQLQDVVPVNVRTNGLLGGLVGDTLASSLYPSGETVNADGTVTGTASVTASKPAPPVAPSSPLDTSALILECSTDGFSSLTACPSGASASTSISDVRSTGWTTTDPLPTKPNGRALLAGEILTLSFAVWVP